MYDLKNNGFTTNKKLLVVFSYIVAIFLIINLFGCNGIGKLKLQISSSDKINPDKHNQSLPLVVKCFQLKDYEKFKDANFNTLWKTSEELLKEDIISFSETIIMPNNIESKTLTLSSKTQYVACLGLFNRPEDNWKDFISIDNKLFSKSVNIVVRDNTIKINKSSST